MADESRETFNFPIVSVGMWLSILREEFTTDMRKDRVPAPMLGIGLAGIGKTEGIAGLAKELKVGFQEMRLVNYTETDLIGIPFLKDGRTEHGTNVLFPDEKRDGKYGILLVDEFTSAARNIQVPILQLTDKSRSVGQYTLPKGWKIVLTGNGPNDGGTFTTLPGTVISRASCYRVIPTVESWLDWASKNGVHHAVRAFIKFSGEKNLHGYNEDEEAGYDRAFPCPRSWTNASVVLKDYDERFPNWSSTEESFKTHDLNVRRLVGARIGVTTAEEFMAFLQFEKDLVDPDEIIKASTPEARKKLIVGTSGAGARQAYFLTITRLADRLGYYAASPQNVDIMKSYVSDALYQAVANGINWALENAADADMKTFAIADIGEALGGISAYLTTQKKFLDRCPNYAQFAKNLAGLFRS